MTSSYERRNRAFWDADADDYQAAHAADLAPHRAPAWGVWRVPESEVRALGPVADHDVLEYGCGAAQWSIALAHDGARPVGLDQSVAQLRHARRLQDEHGTPFPLVAASAVATPFTSEAFDLVFCDHGAMSFCDPQATIPEVARLVRPGGRFVFSKTTALVYLTFDWARDRQDDRLHHDYFGMRLFDSGEGTVDFQLPYGDMVRILRRHGFTLEDLVELQAPVDAATTYHEFVPADWARRWAAEEIWVLTRAG
ncbi:MAG TPA: class I SAM-dependent methyltransferase [Acidimicrobiia bacterium]|nr:class I SAM-dependent methyltransferase [Acidimicrobiia bacterium]